MFNMRPTLRLQYDTRPKSALIGMEGLHANYFKRHKRQWLAMVLMGLSLPYLSVQTYRWLDRLTIWDKRIEKKRNQKIAFDYMLKSMAEKERDILEEFSDF